MASGPGADGAQPAGLEDGLCAKAGIACLALLALGALHALFWHLHAVIVPFVLSAFLVLWLQPYVEAIYGLLSGRNAPHRWCCCGLRRKSAGKPEVLEQAFDEDPPAGACAGVADSLCRFVAVAIVLIFVLCMVACVLVLLAHGAVHMREHWEAYQKGTYRMIRRFDGFLDSLTKELDMESTIDRHMKEAYASALNKADEVLWDALNVVASGFSEGITTVGVVSLYIGFWLMQPLPTGGKAGELVRSYIYKKTVVSVLYGGCVTVLFVLLGVDLAVLFGVISFFLNFVPEVGGFISIIVPIPVILLDGRIEHPFLVLAAALTGQLILKVVFGTVLEAKLIEKDREMSIHPVWVILGLSYFGFVWGPTGMLISVPILAMVKTAALTVRVQLAERGGGESWQGSSLELFLECLEGGREKHPKQGGGYGACAQRAGEA